MKTIHAGFLALLLTATVHTVGHAQGNAPDGHAGLAGPLERPEAPPATAVVTPPPRLDAWAAWHSLSNGNSSWQEQGALMTWQRLPREAYYGGVLRTRRFDQTDVEMHLGAVRPLGEHTALQLEAAANPNKNVLPAWRAWAQLQHQPARGWDIGAGARYAHYAMGNARVFNLSVDRYVGQERLAYTLYMGGLTGSSLRPAHRVQWTHYFSDESWVGLSANWGEEVRSTGTELFRDRVRGVVLTARRPIATNWALTLEAEWAQLESFYTRRGIRAGLRHVF